MRCPVNCTCHNGPTYPCSEPGGCGSAGCRVASEHQRRLAVEQMRSTVAELEQAWEWLLELVVPGRATPAPASATTDDQAERLEAIGHSDRTYRSINLSQGMSALPPSPASARISVLDAHAAVGLSVDAAVRIAERALDLTYVGKLGTVAESVPAALRWLASGPVVADLHLEAALRIERALARANRAARSAAAAGDPEVETVRDRCPACGRRSLERDLVRGDIRCVSESCVCLGPGGPETAPCGCGKADADGQRHVWTRGEQDGPGGLWAVVAAAAAVRPARSPLRRGAIGHGGWQSRGMAGQQ